MLQPALLYIVPGVIGFVAVHSLMKGEVKAVKIYTNFLIIVFPTTNSEKDDRSISLIYYRGWAVYLRLTCCRLHEYQLLDFDESVAEESISEEETVTADGDQKPADKKTD